MGDAPILFYLEGKRLTFRPTAQLKWRKLLVLPQSRFLHDLIFKISVTSLYSPNFHKSYSDFILAFAANNNW